MAAAGCDLRAAGAAPFWAGLRAAGPDLWFEAADAAALEEAWTPAFSGVAVDHALLRAEVEAGAHDASIRSVAVGSRDLADRARRHAAAYAITAGHGAAIAGRFSCSVALPVHPDLADDRDALVAWGLRLQAVDPAHAVVELPFTADALLAARILGRQRVAVHLAPLASARQCLLAAAVAGPARVDLAVGQLAAYLAENDLGDGSGIGERTAIAAQRALDQLGSGTGLAVRGVRWARQLRDLAGSDALVISPAIADAAPRELDGAWPGSDPQRLQLAPAPGLARARPDDAWIIEPALEGLVADLLAAPPADADDLRARCNDFGLRSLLPQWSGEERARFADDGRIPLHHRWLARIERGEAAIDSLLVAAAQAADAADQAAIDGYAIDLLGG